MGVVGVIKPFLRKKKYIKGSKNKIFKVTTLDSCCILINKKHGFKFDEKTFDEYHFFVEDYCMQIKYKAKLNIFLFKTNFYCKSEINDYNKIIDNNYFFHGSNTFINKGSRWGNWLKCKKLLDKKWNRKVITT